MPKKIRNEYLKDYYYKPAKQKKTKKRRNKKPKGFIILISIISLLIIVFLANLFAGFLTLGQINLERGDKYFDEVELYAVELASYDNSADAFTASEGYKEQLAAGYVVNDGGTYRVLASAYKTRSNAESVIDNLKDDNINATIYVIEMPSLYMDLELTDEEKEDLKECFDMFYDTYLAIYNLSVDLDQSTKTLTETQAEILELKEACQQVVSEFNNNAETQNTSEIIYTKIYLNTFMDYLTDLNETQVTDNNYSSEMKDTYFKIIYAFINLKTELAKN